jgi:hypothetical protein
MACYQDYIPTCRELDEIYLQLLNLICGSYSVEVLPDPTKPRAVIFRVWFTQHCDPAAHTRIPTPEEKAKPKQSTRPPTPT